MLTASLASQFMGGHGIVAAFLAGLIISERRCRKESIPNRIYLPVMTILVPVYFVSLGLRTDFAAEFDATIVLLIFAVACAGKIIGAGLGAIAAGIENRKALAVGFGLNARGAMEIALASAALHYGLIEGQIFVAPGDHGPGHDGYMQHRTPAADEDTPYLGKNMGTSAFARASGQL